MLWGIAILNVLLLPVRDRCSTGLLLFVKAPEPGKVKTRLGQSIGLAYSCELYRCFGLDWLGRLNRLGFPIFIFYAPDEGASDIRRWLGEGEFYPQGKGSLGDRMTHAFELGFALGMERLMIFGSDSPDVPLSVIQQGVDHLESDEVVIGPSNDGGYYTIGFSQSAWCPRVFHDIQWSSESVYPDTLKFLRSQPASVHVLPEWDDIDLLSDLKRLYQRNISDNQLPLTMSYIQAHLLPFMETP